jgi:UDP-N-acetylglucosamine--N-acetylmuramyl-(pentapeptide) pyrophosphoryl-undecaprenol N-acetylglucosamine transferase
MALVIALAGGGTMGPTAPIIALQKKLAEIHPKAKFVWVGTPDGPEKQPVSELGIPFVSLPVAKFPRYLSRRLFTWPWDYYKARKAAIGFLEEWRPNIVIGAGGFTQVPLIRVASKRGIPCVIHQLDFEPLLSNRLVAKYCALITTTFVYHRRKLIVPIFKFSFGTPVPEKNIATPNRFATHRTLEKTKAAEFFGLDGSRPIVMFVGGGTGALALNQAVEKHLDKWLGKTQVLHITGKRGLDAEERPGYAKREFLNEQELFNAYMASDLVVTRGGMGSITDLATLGKPCVFVPITNHSQEKNVMHLGMSISVIKESPKLFNELYHEVQRLLDHPQERMKLGYALSRTIRTDDGTEWASLIEKLLPEENEE